MEVITVTRIDHLRALGWEWPYPSYISGIPKLLFRWLPADLPEGEKYRLIGEMYVFDLEQQKRPHTCEAQVKERRNEYRLAFHSRTSTR